MNVLKMLLIGFAIALLVAGIWSSKVVNEDEVALIYRWGHLDTRPLQAGFHLLWPGYSLVIFDKTRHFIKIDEKDPEEGVLGIGAQTSDHYTVGVVVNLEYRIDPARAVSLLSEYGRNDTAKTRSRIEDRIKTEIAAAVRHAVPRFTVEQLIHNRDKLRDIAYFQLSDSSTKPPSDIDTSLLASRSQPTIGDMGISVHPVDISFSVPQRYNDVLAVINEEAYLAEVAKKQDLELANAKRQSLISAASAEGQTALGKSGALGLLTQKWNGVLPSTVLLSNSDLEALRALGIGSAASSAGPQNPKKN